MLAHALDQQRLAEAVVDLVGAGVEQVFSLQINFRSAEFLRQAASEEKWRGTPRIGLEQQIEALLELPIALGLFVFALQFLERGHQSLGNVASAVAPEAPV